MKKPNKNSMFQEEGGIIEGTNDTINNESSESIIPNVDVITPAVSNVVTSEVPYRIETKKSKIDEFLATETYSKLKNGFYAVQIDTSVLIFNKDKTFLTTLQNSKIQNIYGKDSKVDSGFVNVVSLHKTELVDNSRNSGLPIVSYE